MWLSLVSLALLAVTWVMATDAISDIPQYSSNFCCEYPASMIAGLVPLSFAVPVVGYFLVHGAIRRWPGRAVLEPVVFLAVAAMYYVVVPMWDSSGEVYSYWGESSTTYSGFPLTQETAVLMLMGAAIAVLPMLGWLFYTTVYWLVLGRDSST